MNFLVFGAGAIGTYIGGSLALADHRVVFIERPGVAAELSQRGMRLSLNGQDRILPIPQVATSLSQALASGPYDASIFATKAYDTQNTVDGFLPFKDAFPPVICFQNGVENEAVLTEVLGADKVIAGTVTSAIGRKAAGDIVLERLRGVGIAQGLPLAGKLVEILTAAGLHARLFPDAASMKWSKMLTNLQCNATSAILDMTPGEIFGSPQLFMLERKQLLEALQIMRAQGINVVDLPGTPVRALATLIRSPFKGISRILLQRSISTGRGGKMPSFHIDLHGGRGQSEVDYLNGAVVRMGKKSGIDTPVNQLLVRILLDLTTGKRPLDDFAHQPEKLLNLI